MCTAATYKTRDFYMGRTLDYEFSYGDEITVTPRNYVFSLRHSKKLENHYAIIGMAHVSGDYPLYYDAMNEKGLGIAGLNFVGNATYKPVNLETSKKQITQFELIPFILGTCASLKEAKEALENMDLVDTPFSPQLPVGSLHWLIADETGSITVESVKEGLMIYDNPIGVLTNNPPFPTADVPVKQLYALITKTACKYICQRTVFKCLQPWNGRFRSSRRPVLFLPFCQGFLCKNEFPVQRGRTFKRQPVFPYFRFCGSAERLLRSSRWEI